MKPHSCPHSVTVKGGQEQIPEKKLPQFFDHAGNAATRCTFLCEGGIYFNLESPQTTS